ncbi:MAG: hypothetical protein ACRD1Y_13470 [Terriglobales bacterium]
MALAALAPAQQPVVVDAIAAVVNGTPILLSQVRTAAQYARLSAQLGGGEAPPDISPAPPRGAGLTRAEEAAALRHLEDQELVLQARNQEGIAPPAASALAEATAAQWRHLEQAAGGKETLAALLRRDGLDRALVEAQLRRQLAIVEFLDERTSHDPPTAAVSDAAVARYYRTQFVSAARAHHLKPAPLAQVRATIARLLRDKARSEAEAQWLGRLRAGAQIEAEPW